VCPVDLSYKLSSRELVEMMGERGIELAHTPFCDGSSVRAGTRESLEPIRSGVGGIMALRRDI
jgi:hypothetical protein